MNSEKGLVLKGAERNHRGLRQETNQLLGRMLAPLTGLDQQIGFTQPRRRSARFIMAGADLTGVHLLRNKPQPRKGAYHLGGSGVFMDEALIRTLGETVERYTQFTSEIQCRDRIIFATYYEIEKRNEPMLSREKLIFYSDQQHALKGFPFAPHDDAMPLGWLQIPGLLRDQMVWVPAQMILVGYNIREKEGERWLNTAVTTGGAAHTKPILALKNALLELIQIDTAMGHWYSPSTAPRIIPDDSLAALNRIIARLMHPSAPEPRFYWLKNPDLAGISIACLVGAKKGGVPAMAVGLGIDLTREEAMYKALLEAVGVAQLSQVNLLTTSIDPTGDGSTQVDPHRIFDLDSNVSYYALPGNEKGVQEKFSDTETVTASAIPEFSGLTPPDEVALLISRFQESGKELYGFDLTTIDATQLGFYAARVWSPDTLPLHFPSAPMLAHPRYTDFGGARYVLPHPYP